jgi:citrate synthase
MGFGHRFHSRDPRAEAILETAQRHQFSGPHLDTVSRLADILARRKGIAMNIEGAGGAVLLDLGFDPRIGHLFIVLGRSTMFAAAYLERLAQRPEPFQRIEVSDLVDASQ